MAHTALLTVTAVYLAASEGSEESDQFKRKDDIFAAVSTTRAPKRARHVDTGGQRGGEEEDDDHTGMVVAIVFILILTVIIATVLAVLNRFFPDKYRNIIERLGGEVPEPLNSEASTKSLSPDSSRDRDRRAHSAQASHSQSHSHSHGHHSHGHQQKRWASEQHISKSQTTDREEGHWENSPFLVSGDLPSPLVHVSSSPSKRPVIPFLGAVSSRYNSLPSSSTGADADQSEDRQLRVKEKSPMRRGAGEHVTEGRPKPTAPVDIVVEFIQGTP